MNEFIEQFLIEGRELVEQATRDLLALEKQPGDATRLDGVFRAFHTLKGAAGIVDFAAMARALHAAEEVLSAVRAGTGPMTPALVGNCLSALDQVLQWLDVIETSGDMPSNADANADAMVARFVPDLTGDTGLGSDDALALAWTDLLACPGAARIAIRYRPDQDCFFQAQDPLTLLAQVPDLLALRLLPSKPWPNLDEFDPFACHLTLMALSAATRDAAAAALRSVIDQVEIFEIDQAGAPLVQAASDLSASAREILETQIRMLLLSVPESSPGCLASAGRVAVSVLSHACRPTEVSGIRDARTAAEMADDPALLIAALQAVLAGTQIDQRSVAATNRLDSPPTPPNTVTRILRVDVDRIDALVRLTGELTVIKNAVGHLSRQAEAETDRQKMAFSLKDVRGQLDRLVVDLQHAVLSIRVLPLRHVFQRFPRLVRDLSDSLSKSIRLITEGDDAEADKVVVESLFEPLLHVVRNAADHGLEDANGRRATGKPPQGTIRLSGARSGERVIVEIADDGRGINLDRVREVAIQRGIVTAAALATMTNAEVAQLIFAPGFTTATQVTDISGRGVGLDAVRTAIERLGGRVSVESERQKGTKVRFTLPFTLMITRVMTVEAGGQIFGIPLENVIETARISRDLIFPVGAAQAFTLRSRVIPLFDLAETVGIGHTPSAATEETIVIASVTGDLSGLLVDRLGEQIDVMLKPMDGLLSGTPGIAGTTLLGDGRVLIVLDVPELLR